MPSEHPAITQAMATGYIILSASQSQGRVADVYWRWCSDNRHPFVKITGRGRLVQVEMDMATTGYVHSTPYNEHDLACLNEIEMLFRKFAPVGKRSNSRIPWSIGDWPACWKVYKDDADEVAESLLAVGNRWSGKNRR